MRIASLLSILFLYLMEALNPGAFAQASRRVQETRRCKMSEYCNSSPPSRDCTPKVDTRSCTRLVTILNIEYHDSVCEAAKAAQNQNYQLQAGACEAQKEADKAEYEWKRQQCVSIANVCSSVLPLAESTKFTGTRVLWVDDHPDNNTYERLALQDLGATVVSTKDTYQAVTQLLNQDTRFDVVISDFERKGDAQAAYTLLAILGKLSDPVPVVIYSASSTPKFVAEAKRRRAFGETNEPKVLMTLVTRAADFQKRQASKRVPPTETGRAIGESIKEFLNQAIPPGSQIIDLLDAWLKNKKDKLPEEKK